MKIKDHWRRLLYKYCGIDKREITEFYEEFHTLVWRVKYEYLGIENKYGFAYPKHSFTIEGVCTNKTFSGYEFQYRLEARCEVIDQKEFKKKRMLTREGRDDFLLQMNERFLSYAQTEWTGCFFVLYPGDTYPCPSFCNYKVKDDVLVELDCSPLTFYRGSHHVSRHYRGSQTQRRFDIHCRINGCRVNAFSVELLPPTTEMVRRNLNMIPEKYHTILSEDERIAAIEAETIYRYCLEVKNTKEEYKKLVLEPRYGITLVRWILDDGVQMEWSGVRRNQTLWGFRREGGYGSDAFEETKNELCVLDTFKPSGFEIDRNGLKPGFTYSYSFWLREENPHFGRKYLPSRYAASGRYFPPQLVGRFSAHIPLPKDAIADMEQTRIITQKELEITKLKKELARYQEPSKSRVQKEVEQMVESIECKNAKSRMQLKLQKDVEVDRNNEHKEYEELLAAGEITQAKYEEMLKNVDDMYNQMITNIFS